MLRRVALGIAMKINFAYPKHRNMHMLMQNYCNEPAYRQAGSPPFLGNAQILPSIKKCYDNQTAVGFTLKPVFNMCS